jgi:transcriptional regulator with XRE-family HTH domain
MPGTPAPLPWHDDEPLGDLIRRVRTWRGKSQYAIAQALCEVSGNTAVTRLHVYRWESGRRIPRPYWRQYLGKVLDIPVDVLDRAAAVSAELRPEAPGGSTAGTRRAGLH